MALPYKKAAPASLSLTALNHISRNCSSVEDSVHFYSNVLGFVQIKRPGSFDFDGAWLFNYGIGIHLLKDDTLGRGRGYKKEINPKADHISFQCEDMTVLENGLHEHKIKYIRRVVEEGGILVDQLFFHDPDGHMIEICNCQLLPVVPLTSLTCLPCMKSPNMGLPRALSARAVSSLAASPMLSEQTGIQRRASFNNLLAAAGGGGAVGLGSGFGPGMAAITTLGDDLGNPLQTARSFQGDSRSTWTSGVPSIDVPTSRKTFEAMLLDSREGPQDREALHQLVPRLADILQSTPKDKRRRDELAPCA